MAALDSKFRSLCIDSRREILRPAGYCPYCDGGTTGMGPESTTPASQMDVSSASRRSVVIFWSHWMRGGPEAGTQALGHLNVDLRGAAPAMLVLREAWLYATPSRPRPRGHRYGRCRQEPGTEGTARLSGRP